MSASPGAAIPRSDSSDGALASYLRAIRVRWLPVALIAVAAVAGSYALQSAGTRHYEASAEILATPVEGNDPSFLGLDLVRESGDPARTVLTAASVVGSPEAADLTARHLGRGWDRERVLRAVRVEPQGQSSVLAVIATAEDPKLAARLANTFAEASLARRRALLGRQLDAGIRQLQGRLDQERRGQGPVGNATARVLAERLTALESLRATKRDPTLALSQPANVPSASIGAPPWLSVFAGLLAGLVLGSLAALALEALSHRVRDQEELVQLYPLPILAGLPLVPRRSSSNSRSVALEAFRTLRVQLQQLGTGRTILLTSASSGDGKTTVAANLALALVDAGPRVALMDLDLRRPQLAGTVGVSLEGGRPWAFVESPETPGLLVLVGPEAGSASLDSLMERFQELVREGLSVADYVLIDAPPLGEVSDALRIATQVDDVVLVARPRHTRRASFLRVRDLLERFGIVPRGLLVVGERIHTPGAAYRRSSSRGGREAGVPIGRSGSR